MPNKSQSKKRGRPETRWVKIDATPEEVAKAILSTPPKKPHEWKFMQDYKGNTEVVRKNWTVFSVFLSVLSGRVSCQIEQPIQGLG